MRVPEAVRPGGEPGGTGLGAQGEMDVLLQQVGHRRVESGQPLRGWGPGPRGGRPPSNFSWSDRSCSSRSAVAMDGMSGYRR
ncbi:hypothetical protein [Streptomyces sp. ML-6]|uniref:hypothetical protein n=1 Tax=Streptomyces sp. ML-6 TaxID=2982693 RepID=UPI0032DED165